MPESGEPRTVLGPTPNARAVALARLGKVSGESDRVEDSDWVDVHFNPASLQLQLSNELKDQPNQERKQYVAKTSAKLSMDLPFDTTDTGVDVTQTTQRLQAFIAPPLPEGDRARQPVPPPLVMFEWGTLRFKGVVESYKETIDFFSADGVPLRAAVNLTLTRQDQVFDPASDRDPADVGTQNDPGAFDLPATNAGEAANQGGNPTASREIASTNGQESLRFGNGSTLTVGSTSIQLKPAAAFSSGAELSLGAAFDANVGGAFGIEAGLELSASATAGVAGQARLAATEGAFASLRTAQPKSSRLDTTRLAPQGGHRNLSTGVGAQFQAGGQASATGAAGLQTDVGIKAKLKFD